MWDEDGEESRREWDRSGERKEWDRRGSNGAEREGERKRVGKGIGKSHLSFREAHVQTAARTSSAMTDTSSVGKH